MEKGMEFASFVQKKRQQVGVAEVIHYAYKRRRM